MHKQFEPVEVHANILVIDDEANMRHMLSHTLEHAGYRVDTASDGEEGLAKLSQAEYGFVLCDIKMPKVDGIAFLRAAREFSVHPTIIMMSAYGTIDLAVEAIKAGAYDFIAKPFKSDEVLLAIEKAAERDRLKRENDFLRERLNRIEIRNRFGEMVAKSAAMQKVFEMAAKVAQYSTTVLITGESGTGKELVARAIHNEGPRYRHAMVPVNCGGIPENLLESELFGHVKGAFTGADRNKNGLFQEAHAGTIFLDEIGELPPSLQVKLLRVLQEGEVRPVGQPQSRKIDVRVIAATARDLFQMVAQGEFREDLFYRLNVIAIHIPPLRERKEDIPLLCQHFVEYFNQRIDRHIKGIAPAAMSRLLQHMWPGNVRELENAIERAWVLSEGEYLLPEHFPYPIDESSIRTPLEQMLESYSLKDAQKVLEKEMIIKALKATGGNRTHASRLLQISHPNLLSKMKAYQINL
jgi:two-component system, NtrC family, response regulator AtoC